MNFKEIVQKVNLHTGLQGTVNTVDATNYQEYLAEAVRASWVDLQNLREDWKFMWHELEFTTVAGTHEYTESSILAGQGITTYSISKWKKDEFLKDGALMTEVDWIWYQVNKDDFESKESTYFVNKEYPAQSLIIPSPDGGATIRTAFYRTPQILQSNTDIPILPEEFHYLLVWNALEDVAAYLGNSAIYERHSYKADILKNKLMRSQIPARKIRKKPFYRKTLYGRY